MDAISTRRPLACPRCGGVFESAVIIVIPLRERPDLIDRLIDDDLHTFACPRCGQAVSISAPILLHDSQAANAFTFSAPDGMPPAQAEGQVFEVLGLVGATLGQDWTLQAMGAGVRTVPRLELQLGLLRDFARIWQQAIDLFTLAKTTTDLKVFDEAAERWRAVFEHPDLLRLPPSYYWSALSNWGALPLMRFELTGSEDDLSAATRRLRDAVERGIPPQAPEHAGALYNMGRCDFARFRCAGDASALDQAIAHVRAALTLEAVQPPLRSVLCSKLGEFLLERYTLTGAQDDLEQAIGACTEALEQGADDGPDALVGLGNGLLMRHRRSGALSDLSAAIDWYRRGLAVAGAANATRAQCLYSVANALNYRYECSGATGDLDEAITRIDEASATPGADADGFAFANLRANLLHNRFRWLGRRQDLDAAIEGYRAAREAAADTDQRCGADSNLADVLMDRFENGGTTLDLDESLAAARRALQDATPTSPHYAMHAVRLGACLAAQYDRTGAPADLDEARACFHLACDTELDVVEGTLAASQTWGRWALQRQSWAEAATALEYGLKAVDSLFSTQLLRQDKETWLRRARRMPDYAAYAYARVGDLCRCVETLERSRARMLSEALEGQRRDLEQLPALGHGALYERYLQAAALIGQLARSSADRKLRPGGVDVAARLREAREAAARTIRAIQQIDGYETLLATTTIEQIQADLALSDAPVGASLAVYLACIHDRILALVVTSSDIEAIWLDVSEMELSDWVRRRGGEGAAGYLFAQMGAAPLAPALDRLLPTLGARIVGPVAEPLRKRARPAQGSRPHVVLVPPGVLSLLPLHAAPYAASDGPRVMLDEFVVSYAPSLGAWMRCRQRAVASAGVPASLLAIGNPLPLPAPLQDLPFARAEVEQIAPFFAGRSIVLCEEQATLSALTDQLAGCSHLHLACHGVFSAQAPQSSGVLLSGGTPLTLATLLDLPRLKNARLAVLSTCQSAMSDVEDLPEEVVGLPSGFLQAGVPGVIGTLWPVADLSTALLMNRLYRSMLYYGLAPAAALREAQMFLRRVTWSDLKQLAEVREENVDSRPFDHPRYWAPFTFHGA